MESSFSDSSGRRVPHQSQVHVASPSHCPSSWAPSKTLEASLHRFSFGHVGPNSRRSSHSSISKPSISLSLDCSSRGIKEAKPCCFGGVLRCVAMEEERQGKDQTTPSTASGRHLDFSRCSQVHGQLSPPPYSFCLHLTPASTDRLLITHTFLAAAI